MDFSKQVGNGVVQQKKDFKNWIKIIIKIYQKTIDKQTSWSYTVTVKRAQIKFKEVFTMTNAMIIFNAAMKLMDEGIIGTTGRKMVMETPDGDKIEVMEPEVIHTYAVWKSLGYQVKRGEKNIAAITIWKAGKGKQTEQAEEGDQDGENSRIKMFLKTAFFFKASQCEIIAG